ncbi:zinc-dependent alcohol dehydrogenase family protein [Pseudomonas cannabina]|uniref:Zinc-binding dehydrogenase n=1 Tax=Pseudomonas syringae pv. maculicola str. ES4326 TaxID=629265 RepID=A0A8T8C637_PSEYM|nr:MULTISPECIES: zinc-dependent alcohol dehydrogenase family protein [Pseudomonas syringae group]KPB75558.1 putative oxidoreductase [Pseudomonas syringae pv. maculicola]QHE98989.1 zinc-binding dehydrogenase [Pseudomonas syringae pv. maculicola str. ES4326]QQN21249.1 zinc-dependent alcohol dehydrogenase family protein [Pseudomonas cannabina pv. alisalensis]UBY99651.1 zinc-dependent alcohol dehydrogenase family protein [Pseudomonas cannabina pv. alisalensis]
MTRVVRFNQYGGPEVLTIDDIDVAEPGPGEVTIAVKAIGLNRAESMFRGGQYLEEAAFPSRLGYEAAGIVESVGANVGLFAPGDIVSLIPPSSIATWGTYAELAVVPAAMLVKHPSNLSFVEAAAVWMQYVTAWGALVHVAQLQAGEFVLITAASSSVGLAAIQIANQVGAIPIAVSRTRTKCAQLLEAGAAYGVASEDEDFVQQIEKITEGVGTRVIFDPVGGPFLERLVEVASVGGIVLVYGALSPEPAPFPLFKVLGKSLTLRGYLLHEISSRPALLEAAKAYVVAGLEAGKLRPVIARTFPFEQIVEAHRYLEAGDQFGKVVVTVGADT